MSKIIKFVVLPLGVVVLLVLGIAAYLVATFDPNQYKPQIVRAVKDKTKRVLKLDGDIKLSLFPNIGATLGKLSLSEPESSEEFAGIEDFRVSLKLLPLLSKQVVVNEIEIKNLRANLVRRKDGKLSIEDLSSGTEKPAPAASNEQPPIKIDIDHLKVENASLTYIDETAGTKFALSDFNLKTGRIASGVPSQIELTTKVQSDKPKLDLKTGLKATVTFTSDNQKYTLQGLDLSVTGLAAGISDLAATVKGDIDANLPGKAFLISKLAVAATGKQEGGDFDVKLDMPKLTVSDDKISGEQIALTATTKNASNKISAKLDIPSIDGNAKSFKANEISAIVDLQQDGATIKAKLTGPLAGSIEPQRIELAKFVLSVNVNNPKLPKNPLDATINGSLLADLAKENASLTFTTKLDDSNISAKAGLAKFTPPSYSFDVNIDQIDADRYMPKSEPKQKQPAQPVQPTQAAQAEQPIDLSALKGLNANGSLKIGSLKVANIKATKVRIDVKAANGRVDVSPIAASLYEGVLNGALSVQAAATPVIAVKQNLTGISVGPLLKDVANFDTLQGKGNVSIDVSAQGTTVSALKKALSGNASIKLANGAIKGINIAGAIRDATAKLGTPTGETSQAASQTEQTDFSELAATFNIKNGVAHNSDLSGKSPLLRIGGEGNIDIANEQLDYLLKATVVGSMAGQGGQELAQLKGITVPVHLTGAFTAPQYKIDFTGLAAGVGKALVESKKEEIKAKVQDQVKDQLKGLFGR